LIATNFISDVAKIFAIELFVRRINSLAKVPN